jgi:hypothetical protein
MAQQHFSAGINLKNIDNIRTQEENGGAISR